MSDSPFIPAVATHEDNVAAESLPEPFSPAVGVTDEDSTDGTETQFITTRIFDILVEKFVGHLEQLADEHYGLTVQDILDSCRKQFILHDPTTLEIVKLAFDNCVDEADFRETLNNELNIVE